MPNVLTIRSVVSCGHGGTVAVQGTAKLAVAGAPVLLAAGVKEQAIDHCGTKPASDPSGPTAIPCHKVLDVNGGGATKLTVDRQPVLLDTLQGATDGMVAKVTPQLLLPAQANQTKLSSS